MKYELLKSEYTELIDSLVNIGALRRIVETSYLPDPSNIDPELQKVIDEIGKNGAKQLEEIIKSNGLKERTVYIPIGKYEPSDPDSMGLNLYLNNGKAIEHNIEEISRTAFGFVEEKKLWGKELKLAVKEHGHDEVLSGFYNWCENNSNFKGTKPVGLFLKNVASNIGFVRKAPGFSNPNLDYVIKEIGYLTDNKVMFWGNTRAVLAKSIQEHGVENVLEAWRKFYNEDDNPSFAANGFISQIDILVYNVNKRKKEAANAQLAIEAAYRDAQATVQTEPEEELEEL